MSDDALDPTALRSYAAVLVVSSVPDAIDWYTNHLALDEGIRYGDPVTFGGVCKGGITIHLQAASETPRPVGGSSLSIFVGDAMAMHQRLVDRGLEIEVPPAPRDYGLIDFSVLDPDGNRLVFGSDVEGQPH